MLDVRVKLAVTKSRLAEVHGDRSRRLRVQAVRCRNASFECDGVVWAQAAAHAKVVHNLGTISEEMVDQVRRAMREE
jgi:predicted small metal-binding protein